MDSDRTGRHRRVPDPLTLPPRAYAAVVAIFLAGLLLSGGVAVVASTPAAAGAQEVVDPADYPPADPDAGRLNVLYPAGPPAVVPSPSVTTVAVPIPPAPDTWTAVPLPGEGMLALVTRICGDDRAGSWRANALANGVTPPRYVVRLDAKLTLDCEAEVLPPDPSELAPPPPPPAAAVVAAPAASGGWVNPLSGTCIGSGYGMRWGRMHYGLDLAAASGTPILAAAGGTVTTQTQISYDANGNPQGAGHYTVIDHGGVWTVYMHLSSWAVTSGWVNAGDAIGYVGSTGGSTGPHLHFEVHTSLWNTRVDPDGWMWDRGVGWGWC